MNRVFLEKLSQGDSLTDAEMVSAMKEIMLGRVAEEEIVNFLTLLRKKGENPEEILAAATVLREFSVRVNVPTDNLVDTCGTGGDEKGSFNISTAAAFVVAGCGVGVAKHGNRAVSSRSGSADVLEALGVRIDVEPVVMRRSIQEAGIGFFFAPRYHPAMKNVASARKKVGKTIFNLLGPLANPAQPIFQVVGIYDRSLMKRYAEVLKRLGLKHALVVHGEDGMDELTLTGKSHIVELWDDIIREYSVDPRDFGLELCHPSDLQGGDASYNANLLRGLLEGYVSPLRDVVLLNAAAALIAANRVKEFGEGLMLANHALDQGRARGCLKKLIEITNE
ncbi:MAG: anthranilate phosphoribosyltransferase [Deltaproteobacteria bacterium]|nr:anthranilate phosphoribosyltransferase [Deltaproteobacteria bacterium]